MIYINKVVTNAPMKMKAMIVIPALQVLLIERDEFEKENTQNERGYEV